MNLPRTVQNAPIAMPIFKGVRESKERLPAHIQAAKPIDFRSVTGFSSNEIRLTAAGRAPVVATRDFDELVSQQRDATFLDKLIKKDKNGGSSMRISDMEKSDDRTQNKKDSENITIKDSYRPDTQASNPYKQNWLSENGEDYSSPQVNKMKAKENFKKNEQTNYYDDQLDQKKDPEQLSDWDESDDEAVGGYKNPRIVKDRTAALTNVYSGVQAGAIGTNNRARQASSLSNVRHNNPQRASFNLR